VSIDAQHRIHFLYDLLTNLGTKNRIEQGSSSCLADDVPNANIYSPKELRNQFFKDVPDATIHSLKELRNQFFKDVPHANIHSPKELRNQFFKLEAVTISSIQQACA
jgi:hypothetical protein